MFGVPEHTLRHWDNHGLVVARKKDIEGAHRFYEDYECMLIALFVALRNEVGPLRGRRAFEEVKRSPLLMTRELFYAVLEAFPQQFLPDSPPEE